MRKAVDDSLAAGVATPDLGGSCTTKEAGDEVVSRLRAGAGR